MNAGVVKSPRWTGAAASSARVGALGWLVILPAACLGSVAGGPGEDPGPPVERLVGDEAAQRLHLAEAHAREVALRELARCIRDGDRLIEGLERLAALARSASYGLDIGAERREVDLAWGPVRTEACLMDPCDRINAAWCDVAASARAALHAVHDEPQNEAAWEYARTKWDEVRRLAGEPVHTGAVRER